MLYPLSYEGGGWRIPARKLGVAVESGCFGCRLGRDRGGWIEFGAAVSCSGALKRLFAMNVGGVC